MPIAVEVAHGHGNWTGASRDGRCRLEGPIAVAYQHRHGSVPGVRDRQILHSIAVEVAHGD